VRGFLALTFILAAALPATAQDKSQPTGNWQTPGEVKPATGPWQTPGEVKAPTGPWQTPGEIKPPTGPWQKPGDIQVPKGIQAVKAVTVSKCERHLSVLADALFDFDKSSLRADAEETLLAAAPEIKKLGKPARIEGHTDAKGGDAYNMRLSEARATTVRDWMARHDFVPAATPIKGFGKTKPVAPNVTADGKDDPAGRQKNRRVEVVFDTCG
jgi:outer membrane protein OmpA-like peptidoglycan-associated protein